MHVVVGNGDDGTVVQDGDGDKCDDWNRKVLWPGLLELIRVVEYAGNEEKEQKTMSILDL